VTAATKLNAVAAASFLLVGCTSSDAGSVPTPTPAPALTTPNAEIPRDLDLARFYVQYVGTSPELADCLAAAARTEGVESFADLEAAEADTELSGRIAERQAACS